MEREEGLYGLRKNGGHSKERERIGYVQHSLAEGKHHFNIAFNSEK